MKQDCGDRGDVSPRLTVRDATFQDLEALIRLKSTAALHRDRLYEAQRSGFRYYVIARDEQVIGFACLVFARPAAWSDAQDMSHLPQIVDLFIMPELRSKGYGTRLIECLEQAAIQRGHKKIYIAVDPKNNPRAFALYARLGYDSLQTEPYLKYWSFVDSDGKSHAGEDWIIDMRKSLSGK